MNPAPEFRRILLIRRKALGDALVTLPAVIEVSRAWPGAAIDLVIDRPFAPLMQDLAPEVKVLSWPPSAGTSWLRTLRAARYDLVLDWLGNPRTAWWTLATGAAVRVGYDLPRRRWAYNIKVPRNQDGAWQLRKFAGEAFLDPLRSLGLAPAPWREGAAAGRSGAAPGAVRAEVTRWRDAWLERPGIPVLLAMSATWAAKRWPATEIKGLLAALPDVGVNPALAAGPEDDWLLQSLQGTAAEALLAPRTNLSELACLLESARLFVGTDCGPRHLAASLGRPTVTIFGPTDPGGWNPAHPRHVSVRNPVPCAPCHLQVCPVAGHPCLENLGSGTVIASVRKILDTMEQKSDGG